MLFVLYGRKTVFLKMDLPCTYVYVTVTDLTKAFDKDSHSAVDETEYSKGLIIAHDATQLNSTGSRVFVSFCQF